MTAWISENTALLVIVPAASFVVFAAGMASLPFIIGILPENFFMEDRKPWFRYLPPGLSILVFVAKNVLGVILLLFGIAMLFTPGQGLLTIVVGLGAMNFPGKHRLVYKILSFKRLRTFLNWIRRKRGAREFLFPFPE